MPQVPIYEQQIRQVETPKPQLPVFDMPQGIEQASEAQMAANKGYADTIMKVGQLLANRAAERIKMEADANVANQDTLFRVELQNKLIDTTLDDKKKPKGFLARQLDQAKDITPEFDQAYEEMKQRYVEGMSNDYQKALLSKAIGSQYVNAREQILRHEATQGNLAYNKSIDANLALRIAGAAAIQNPKNLQAAIDEAKLVNAERDTRNGFNTEEIALNGYKISGEMTKNAVFGLLDSNYVAAKSLFDGVKKNLNPEQVKEIQSTIDGKALTQRAQTVWSSVAGPQFKMKNGEYDLSKIESTVGRMSFNPKEMETVVDYVRDKAREANQNFHAQERNNDNNFLNAVIDIKNKGGTLDQALQLLGRYGRDNADKLEKQVAAKKIFAPRVESDPVTYIKLWEGIQSDSVPREAIDAAFKQDSINVNDWRSLREKYFSAKEKGQDQVEKDAYNKVKIMAEEKYGGNTLNKEKFLYQYQQYSKDKNTYDDKIGVASRLLESDRSTGFWGMFRDPSWKVEQKKIDENRALTNAKSDAVNTAWDKVHLDVGRNQVLSIGKGVLSQGGASWGLKDVDAFAQQVGGYQNLKVGKPANNAIRSLIKRGKLVTPYSVNTVLKIYPDGNAP